MKDDFNFEATLGQLANCIANRNYRVNDQLKKLAAHADHPDVLSTLTNTIDFLMEKTGANSMLYMLGDLLGDMKNPKTIEGNYLQAKLVEKWTEACDAGEKSQPDSTLSYLTTVAGALDKDDPLGKLALPRWEKMVDAQWPLTGFDIKCTLAIDQDIKNADFRKAALTRLAKLKTAEPETVLKMLTDTIERGGFFGFKEKDPESAQILVSTVADILDANKGTYDRKKIIDTAWKVIAHGEGCDAAGEKKSARALLDAVAQDPDINVVFNYYRSVAERKSPHVAAESREASFNILDMVDAGKLKRASGGIDEVTRCVADEIFAHAIDEKTKDDALAARASATLLDMVREELTGKNTHSSYQYYNAVFLLLKYYPPGDPRADEAVKLWEDALTKSHKTGDDDYYARQMGWMLDTATERGDTAMAATARQEWRDTMENIAKKRPGEAYRTVQQIVVNAESYAKDSPLVAEARAIFPDLEARSGIKKMPETMSSDDFLKLIGKKKPGAFKP